MTYTTGQSIKKYQTIYEFQILLRSTYGPVYAIYVL